MDVNKYYFLILTLLLCYKNVTSNNNMNTAPESQIGNKNNEASIESGSGSGSGDSIDKPMLNRRVLCPSGDTLKIYLCHSVRMLVAEFPGGGAATYFMDTFFTTGDAPDEKWNAIKTQVERYVADQIDVLKAREFNRWRSSMIDRVNTCKHKTIKSQKISCYKNLQEDLSGYESMFKGTADREKSLYYEHYEFFVTTFLAVSDRLIDIGDAETKASIRNDVRRKAASFKAYIRSASLAVQNYGCRIIKIKVERSGLFKWYHVATTRPEDRSNKRRDKFVNETLNVSLAHKRRGCGLGRKSQRFRSRVYNSKTKSYPSGGPWSYTACSTNEAIETGITEAIIKYIEHQNACKRTVRVEFLKNVNARLQILNVLSSGQK